MKTLLALTALAIGFSTLSHAANNSTGFIGFARLDFGGMSVTLPGPATREVSNENGCTRTDQSYSPNGFDYRVSVSVCAGPLSNDYATIINRVQQSQKVARVFETKPMSFNGTSGMFTHFENGEGMTVFYWVATRGNRLYQLIAVHGKNYSFNNDAKIMFESFRITE